MMRLPQRTSISILGLIATTGTSLAFMAALEDKLFILVGFGMSALIVLTGIVMRGFRAPVWSVVPAQLLVLAEALVLSFADHRKFGVLPTRGSLRDLADLFADGSDAAQALAPPVPSNTGILLMVVLAIAVTAIAVDALAVGLHRVPLAGLPLLALYTIPVAALTPGIPWYMFVPGAATYVAMLTFDERDRLGHWGRLVTRDLSAAPSEVDLSSVRDRGRQIGVVAVSAAVVLPIIIPTFGSAILDGNRTPGSNGDGDGGGTISFQDPMVSLAESLQQPRKADLLDITSPDVQPSYIRMTVLDNPTANAWTSSGVNFDETEALGGDLPLPTGMSPDINSLPHTMTIDLTDDFPQNSRWLPVPFFATYVGAGPDFGYVRDDQTVAVTSKDEPWDTTSTYQVSYNVSDITDEELRHASDPPPEIVERYGFVPDDVPESVRETADAVTAGALTPYDKAVLLQNYFRDNPDFSYDVDAAYGTGYEAMADFLKAKSGFCQQYSATMAMMARVEHIPSRIVVGFLQARSHDGDHYVMTSHDLHAWPELYFGGIGWVKFEPTPDIGAPYPTYAGKDGGATQSSSNISIGHESNRPSDIVPSGRLDDPGAVGGSGGSGGGPKFPLRAIIVLLALAIALVPAGARRALRRSRLTKPVGAVETAESAWAELQDTVIDLRLSWAGSMSPRAREASLVPYLGGDLEAQQAMHRLALAIERARFANRPSDDDPAVDVVEVIAAINRGCTRYQRFKATFVPSSLRPDLRSGWGRIPVEAAPRASLTAGRSWYVLVRAAGRFG